LNETNVVVDTNIFFSFLLCRETESRRVFLTDSAHTFFCPRFFFVELFKHKERVSVASQLADEEVLECMHELLTRVQFVDEGCIPIGTWMEVRRLCRDVDLKDAPFGAHSASRWSTLV
jgi:predicted nucleic acid-binding protein